MAAPSLRKNSRPGEHKERPRRSAAKSGPSEPRRATCARLRNAAVADLLDRGRQLCQEGAQRSGEAQRCLPSASLPASFVEIGHSIAAPYAGMILSELGAEVIKVSPAIGNSIPSVAMDDGTLSPVVIGPIANPINAHAASAHNCRDHGRPPSMRMPHDERRQCKDLTHRQIDLAANQRQTLDDPLATSRSSLGHNTEVFGSLRPSRLATVGQWPDWGRKGRSCSADETRYRLPERFLPVRRSGIFAQTPAVAGALGDRGREHRSASLG
jgi:CoA-transferase family III